MDKNKVLFSFIRMGISIIVILLVVYFAVRLAMVGYDFGYRVFTEPAVDMAPGREVLVQIKEDMSEKDAAELLEEQGLVRDANLFYLQFKLSVYSGKMVPGVYTLSTSMEPKEIMAVISPEQETETEELQDESPIIDTEKNEAAENAEESIVDEFSADDDFVAEDDFVEEDGNTGDE